MCCQYLHLAFRLGVFFYFLAGAFRVHKKWDYNKLAVDQKKDQKKDRLKTDSMMFSACQKTNFLLSVKFWGSFWGSLCFLTKNKSFYSELLLD